MNYSVRKTYSGVPWALLKRCLLAREAPTNPVLWVCLARAKTVCFLKCPNVRICLFRFEFNSERNVRKEKVNRPKKLEGFDGLERGTSSSSSFFFFLIIQNGSDFPVFLPASLLASFPRSLAKLPARYVNLSLWQGAGPVDLRRRRTLGPTCTQGRRSSPALPARAAHPPTATRARAITRRLTLSQTLTPSPWP